MSSSRPRREVAHRLFAAEFDDATVAVADSEEEMAPTYVLTPTGALVNRAFVVGVLTEVEQVGTDIYRGRVNDPTGTFVAYAGQYQPSAANFLADAEAPEFVALTGKARTFQPDGSDRVYASIRPERIVRTSSAERDRWVAEAARHTLARIELIARARANPRPDGDIEGDLASEGVRPALARGIARAVREYDTSPAYLAALRRRAIEALEVVAGERDAVEQLDLAPDADDGPGSYAELATDAFAATFLTSGAAPLGPVEADETEGDVPLAVAGEEPAEADQVDDGPTEATAGAQAAPVDEPPEAADVEAAPGEYELSEEERRTVEDEFGTEFATGDDIEPADGEAAPDRQEDPVEPDGATHDRGADDTADAEDEATDLQTVVLSAMRRLDEGDGVDRGTLVEAVLDEEDTSRSAVDDAIQEALMSGSCYEPSEDRLKPI